MTFCRNLIRIGCLLMGFVSGAAFASDAYQRLLDESKLQYSPSDKLVSVESSDIGFPAESLLATKDGSLLIAKQIRPISRLQVDYEDPHNSAPHPNDLFDMLFRATAGSVSLGGVFDAKAYTPEQAEILFNAGWAAVAVMDIKPDVSRQFRQGLLLAIHKNDAADAYTLFLSNDLQSSKPDIRELIAGLSFVKD